MARPIIQGIIDKGIAQVYVTDILRDALQAFCAESGAVCSTQKDILEQCDAVVLAVKPQVLPALLPELAEEIDRRGLLVISIAAGKKTEYIGSFFSGEIPIVRIFPNLNARVKAAVSAYCANKYAKPEDIALAKSICLSFGSAYDLVPLGHDLYGRVKFFMQRALDISYNLFDYLLIHHLAGL